MFFVALGLALVIIALCYIISVGSNYNEKLSSYECGFNAYEDSRGIFDVKFYLVAILFLIFDLEALFFFP
jgi:NADH-quinone oxidoreductase subunit A